MDSCKKNNEFKNGGKKIDEIMILKMEKTL